MEALVDRMKCVCVLTYVYVGVKFYFTGLKTQGRKHFYILTKITSIIHLNESQFDILEYCIFIFFPVNDMSHHLHN